MTDAMPDWATGLTDLHVHTAPSLMPRHGIDSDTVCDVRALGFETVVLKSHEGSSVERAELVGANVYGGIVLNSTVGGANPDAVQIAARLGARVAWMPTASARNHVKSQQSAELSVHSEFVLRTVDVVEDGALLPEWNDVLDVVAAHDLLLASGHLSIDETLVLFREARRRGVRRLMVNHPLMPFIGWHRAAEEELRQLDAHLELGILPDILSGPAPSSISLSETYPTSLLVFGGDLGHAHYPRPEVVLPTWLRRLEKAVGEEQARAVMSENGRRLLLG